MTIYIYSIYYSFEHGLESWKVCADTDGFEE